MKRILVLALSACALVSGSESSIGRIEHSQKDWKEPISLSRVNAGVSNVQMTFNFRPSTTLTQGVVEVHFPSNDFNVHSGAVNAYGLPYVLSEQSVQGNSDNYFTFLVDLPSSSGIYGPFKIVTRHSSGSQIFDANYNFGFVGIAPSTHSSSLSVSTDLPSPVVLSENKITLAFTLQADLYKHDILMVIPPNSGANSEASYWTAPQSPSCKGLNSLKGSAGQETLDCFNQAGTVYIYGISQDVSASEKIELEIESFTAPGAEINNKQWEVQVRRLGVNNLVQRFTGSGPTGVTAASSSAPSVTPTKTFEINDYALGMRLYATISFTATKPIPGSGKAKITTENFSVTDEGCYTAGGSTYINCERTSSNLVQMTFYGGIPTGTTINTYVYAEVLSGAKVAKIETFTYNDEKIEETSEAVLTIGNYNCANSFELGARDNENSLIEKGGYLSNSDKLYFSVVASVSKIDETSRISIHGPISDSLSLDKLMITPSLTTTISPNSDYSGTSISTSYTLTTSTESSPGKIEFIQTGNIIKQTSQVFGKITTEVTEAIALPLVPEMIVTFYEFFLKLEMDTDVDDLVDTIEIRRTKINIHQTADPNISFGTVCQETNLLYFSIHSPHVEIDNTFTLEIELESSSDQSADPLGIGPSNYNSYMVPVPFYSNLGGTATVRLGGGSTTAIIEIKPELQLNPSDGTANPWKGYVYNNVLPNSTTDANIIHLVYYLPEYPNIPFYLYKQNRFSIVSSSAYTVKDLTTGGNDIVAGGEQFNLDTVTLSSSMSTKTMVIQAPKGFDLTGASIPGEQLITLPGPEEWNESYGMNYIIVESATTTNSLDLQSLKSQKTTTTTSTVNFEILGISPGSFGSSCEIADQATENIVPGTIDSVSFSMNLNGQSFQDKAVLTKDSTVNYIEVSFTPKHAIPAGGAIEIVLESRSILVQGQKTEVIFPDIDSANQPLVDILSPPNILVTNVNNFQGNSQVKVRVHNVMYAIMLDTSITPVQSITTKSSDGFIIDQNSSIGTSIDLEFPPDPQGKTEYSEFKVYPNTENYQNADLYMKFSFTKNVPSKALIKFNHGNGKAFSPVSADQCFSNLQLETCSTNSGVLEVTLANNYYSGSSFELYLHKAYNLPGAGSANKVYATVTYLTEETIKDTEGESTFTVGTSGSVSDTSVTAQVTTVGQTSTYSFTFTPSTTIVPTDRIYFEFPHLFDPYVGSTQNVLNCGADEKETIPCKLEGAEATCTLDHWKLVVSPQSNLTGPTTLEVFDVYNPFTEGQVSGFSMYVKDAQDNYTLSNGDLGIVTLTPVGSLVNLKQVVTSADTSREETTLSVEFVIAAGLTQDQVLQVHLPEPFELELDGLSGSTTCQVSFYENTEWAPLETDSECKVSGNVITQELVTHSLGTSNHLKISIEKVPIPSWGFERTPSADFELHELDITQKEVYGNYDLWTKSITLTIYNNSTGEVVHQSTSTLDKAYFGFKKGESGASSGNYDPKTKTGGIDVEIGTQTQNIELSIEDDWLESKRLKYIPYSGNLLVTSSSNFTLHQAQKSVGYSVAAPSGISSGRYYIEWSTEEEKQKGVSQNKYQPPVRTLVNVCPSTSKNKITVTVPEKVYVGKKSVPIRVEASKAPASRVVLTITPSSKHLTVNPEVLTLQGSVSYFEVTVDPSHEVSTSEMSFGLYGADQESFEIDPKITLSIENPPESPLVPRVSVTASETGRNTATASFQVSGTSAGAVVYYYLTCKGRKELTYNQLVAKVKSLVPVEDDEGTNIELQLQEEHLNYEAGSGPEDKDYLEFVKRKQAEHCSKEYVGAQVVYSSESVSQVFEKLLPGQSYLLYAFVWNGLTQTSTAETAEFTTQSPPDSERSIVSITRTTKMTEEDFATIAEVLAKHMGVNPEWLYPKGPVQVTENTLRRLQTTYTNVFEYDSLYDSFNADINPSTFVPKANTDTASVRRDFISARIMYDSDTLNFVSSEIIPSGTGNSFTALPLKSTSEGTSATFKFTTALDGYVYTSCSSLKDSAITSKQVKSGLDSQNNKVPSGSAQVTQETETTLTLELPPGSTYYCYFSACDESLTNPFCEETSQLPYVELEIHQCADGSCGVCDNILCLECEYGICSKCASNAVLNQDETCECKAGYVEESGSCNLSGEVKRAKSTGQILAGTTTSSAAASSAFNPNPAALWALLNTLDILMYLSLSTNPLTPSLRAMLEGLDILELFVPNLFEFVLDSDISPMSNEIFEDFGFESTLFLLNMGQKFTIFAFVLVLWPIVWVVSMSKIPFLAKKCEGFLSEYKYNFFLRNWIQLFLDLSIAAVIQISNSPSSNGIVMSSYCIGVMFSLLLALSPLALYLFIKKNQSKFNSEDSDFRKRWGTLVYEYDCKQGSKAPYTYFVFFLKRALFAVSLVLLGDYPVLQHVINTLLMIGYTAFIIAVKPIKDSINQVTAIITETLTCLVFIGCSYFLQDSWRSHDQLIEDLLIYSTLGIVLVQSSAGILPLVVRLVKWLKNKNRNPNARVSPVQFDTESPQIEGQRVQEVRRICLDSEINESRQEWATKLYQSTDVKEESLRKE